MTRKAGIIFACGILLALTGCEAVGVLTGGGTGEGATGGASSAPILQTVSTPRDVVTAFLNAWSAGDYDAMYARISERSQSMTTQVVFREIYTSTDETIRKTGVTHTISSIEEQGESAAVTYNVSVASSLFGEIPDDNRVMRLVRENGEWRVAWSQMDIFDGYAPGSRLEVDSERQTRGNIYDRNGLPLVEQGGTVVELYVQQQNIVNFDACLDTLSHVLFRPRVDLVELFNQYRPETIFGVGDIDEETFNINAASLTGDCNIGTDTRQTRRYAGHGAAVRVTGYIAQIPAEQAAEFEARGYNAGDLVGVAGVESAYEAELAGDAARVLRIIEPGGLVVRELAGASGSDPQDVTLTIDYRLQYAAIEAFNDAYNLAAGNWGGRSPGGALVALDVNTGAVLAMVSYPTFDPAAFAPDTSIFQGQYITSIASDPRLPQRNRATQDQYSPGSVFKIVTTAAAAAERVWNPTDLFYCGMEWEGAQYGDSRPVRYDWRNFEPDDARFATGDITMAQALASSCNPFFYQMGAILYDREPTALINYARRMGLGEVTGIDPDIFPAEARGQIRAPSAKDENISIAIGQLDTQVSVLQMARLVAGIANGGTLYTPYVVQQVGGGDGQSPTFTASPIEAGEMGLSENVLAIVREGMCAVTDGSVVGQSTGRPLGTAWFVFDSEGTEAPYTSCAKTGTAQTARIEPHGWFVIYAPAENPQIAIAVMTEHSREGSETSAPIARRVLDAYFNVPAAPFPSWWYENPYVELQIPQGNTGG